jgi:hypothetical protein
LKNKLCDYSSDLFWTVYQVILICWLRILLCVYSIFFIKIIGKGSELNFSAILCVTMVHILNVDDSSQDVLEMSATVLNTCSNSLHYVSRDMYERE